MSASLRPLVRTSEPDPGGRWPDAQSVEFDIRSRWHEAQAGLRWAIKRDDIVEKCKKLGTSEEQWCKDELGCDIATMRRRVQLYRNWDEYAEQRRAQGNNEQRGLRYALSLIPVNRRYATNSPPSRDRSARAGSDATLDLSWCEFITGDALEVLKALPSNSVQCIITSPPFWPLRRTFGGIGIGFERTLQGYITNLLAVFRECKRVLRKDGLLWLHLEDAYSYSGGQWRPDSVNTWRSTAPKKLMQDGGTATVHHRRATRQILADDSGSRRARDAG